MSIIKISVPQSGDALHQAVVLKWMKQTGDIVEQGEEIVELETDKANLTISAEEKGKLEILVKEGEIVKVGQIIGELNTFSWSL